VRIAWTLRRGPHVLAIPGTGNTAHLTENMRTGALPGVEELGWGQDG
jgi:pyridoxine 4-dehydrogenase